MITLETLEHWLTVPAESERLEFKEAKTQYDTTKLLRYCVALANEHGGHLVLGVTDKSPRRVVGTKAFPSDSSLNAIKAKIVEKLNVRVEVTELAHPDGRVLVFQIPSRPVGHPLAFDGAYLMRAGEDLVPMTPDQLRRIFAEGEPDWFAQAAKENASADDVIALLDTQAFFELCKRPYPTTREAVLEHLNGLHLIENHGGRWTISNLAAILLAKKLDAFSLELARKAPRVIFYEGIDRTRTREDKPGNKGYAVGFDGLVDFIHASAPLNRSIEQVVREEIKMFPEQAIRELVANALVHQDFLATGTSVMIEMFTDRLEISNPGIPPILVERFIDEHQSPNERLADMMRRLHICEEKGSGVDKVVTAAEVYQLPAPDFRVGERRTTAVLFSHQDFATMPKADRIRACYQHCCLMYVSNRRMSNQSLRERFGLPASKGATVSLIIGAAKEANLIKPDEAETSSTRYARYLPFWA
ncbi:MAG: putative DNA binding domain-containing protein [Magnetococcales bacterium]|nr:putative DNA binding domain-containing protein [Magnetococcales bacterium]